MTTFRFKGDGCSMKAKNIIVITILTIGIIVFATLFMLESAKTKTSGQLLEDLLIGEHKIKYHEDISNNEISELSTYISDNNFNFTNVIEIYDEDSHNMMYQIEYIYDSHDEIVITKINEIE